MADSPGEPESPPPDPLAPLAPLPAQTQLPDDYGLGRLPVMTPPHQPRQDDARLPAGGLPRMIQASKNPLIAHATPQRAAEYAHLQFAPMSGALASGQTSREDSPLTDIETLENMNAVAGPSRSNGTHRPSINVMDGYASEPVAPKKVNGKDAKDDASKDIVFTKKRKLKTAEEKEQEAAAKAARLKEKDEKRALKLAQAAEAAERKQAREAKKAAQLAAKEAKFKVDAEDEAMREPGRDLQSPFAMDGQESKPRKAPKKRVANDEGERGGSPVKKAKTTARVKLGPRKAVEDAIALSLRTGKYYNAPRDRKGKAGALTDADIKTLLLGKTVEVQLATCLRSRYAEYKKCLNCVKKSGFDGCRFRYFRCFPIDPETGAITGNPYFQSRKETEDMPCVITDYNRAPEARDRQRIKSCVAPALLPLITRELQHVASNKALTRPLPMNDRALCDFCSVTIFGGSFFCKCCGREYCLSCNEYMPSSADAMRDSPAHLDDAARPRLMICFTNRKHARPDMIPISRFTEASLRRHWLALTRYCRQDETVLLSVGPAQETDTTPRRAQEEEPGDSAAENADLARHERRRREDLERRARDLGRQFYAKKTRTAEANGIEQPVDPAGIPSQPFLFVKGDEMSPDLFDALWTRGEPIVVDGLQDRFKQIWDPKTFIDRSGTEECSVSDCQTLRNQTVEVGQFFARFGESAKARKNRTWKLKDWPTNSDFKTKFPDLFDDFSQTLPAPDYTRRDGVLNISSFFPDLDSRPDIGPKMYNAFAGVELGGRQRGLGTTRLHMDMADAINIMTFAQPDTDTSPKTSAEPEVPPEAMTVDADGPSSRNITDAEGHAKGSSAPVGASDTNVVNQDGDVEMASVPQEGQKDQSVADKSLSGEANEEGRNHAKEQKANTGEAMKKPQSAIEWQRTEPPASSTGCAVWDIFRAEDSNAIRDYLTEKWKHQEKFSDPIHSQIFYLNSTHRQELYETKGVFAHRIYQYPGQAVFIPAGCAHQVCNLADCIKIACDFVSPHNVERCLQLAKEFRSENTVHFTWKEDVLQFNNTLWFAWLSCNTLDKLSKNNFAKTDGAVRSQSISRSLENGQTFKEADGAAAGKGESHEEAGPTATSRNGQPQIPGVPPAQARPDGPADGVSDALATLDHPQGAADSPNPLELLANQAQKQERLASPAPLKELVLETLREPSDDDIVDPATERLLADLLAQTPTDKACPSRVDQPQDLVKTAKEAKEAKEARAVVHSGGTLRTATLASAAAAAAEAAAASTAAPSGKGAQKNGQNPLEEKGLVRMTSPTPEPTAEPKAEDSVPINEDKTSPRPSEIP